MKANEMEDNSGCISQECVKHVLKNIFINQRLCFCVLVLQQCKQMRNSGYPQLCPSGEKMAPGVLAGTEWDTDAQKVEPTWAVQVCFKTYVYKSAKDWVRRMYELTPVKSKDFR